MEEDKGSFYGLLRDRTVLITGAARGVGRATARIMAEEGADIGVIDILPEVEETSKAIADAGGRSAWAAADIADPEQVHAAVESVRGELGDIEVLVNNAGIVTNIARLVKMDHGAWQREIAVNLGGPFNLIKEVIGPMVEKGWGRIINISSGAATGGLKRQVAYAASKAGILGLTKTITLEHAENGITCNAIMFGMIHTELVSMMPEEIKEGAKALIPAQRFGKMEEAGYLITFLASDLAAYINGAEIDLDGGMRLNVGSLGSRREAREKSGRQ
ncbi:MAG: SDR family NAD(P)-dependent oxidoreductase [Actinomycetota bacterium]